MPETHRDAGLVRAVTTWGLASSIINCVIGAGIFAVPAAIAAAVGIWAPVAFLLCAAIVGSVAICFAEGGSRIPTSGGPFGYIEFAMGPLAGFVAGNLLWVGDALASGGVAAAVADTVAGRSLMLHTGTIVGVLGAITLINYRGVSQGTRLIGVMTILKLVPLVIFLIAGVTAIHPANFTTGTPITSGGFGRAIILAVYAFTGMENVLCISGEVAKPERTIPRALAIATVSITFLYIAIQLVAEGILGPALPNSTTPLADAMGHIHPSLRIITLAGAALAMSGYLASDLLGTPRMIFAFGREGALPRVFGRVHSRNHTPHIAILAYGSIVLLLAVTGTFAELAVLSTLVSVLYYGLGCIAAWLLVRRKVALAGQPLDFPWLAPTAVFAIAAMIVMIALAARNEILGLAGFVALTMAAYSLMRRFQKR